MINFIDLQLIKNKFATLLSKLYFSASLGLDNISDKIIDSSYFNFFEENDTDAFMKKSYEDISLELFNARFNKDVDDIGPVYWSGIQYMNIMFNYQIPLRTIFLLWPLQVMVDHYGKFHEMNEIELCKEFDKSFKEKSIIKELRIRAKLSVRQLAELTGVDFSSIRYFEMDNMHLFKSPTFVTNAIANALGVDNVFFKIKSSFLPLSINLIDDQDFLKKVGFYLKSLYLSEPLDELKISYSHDCEKPYLYLSSPSVLFGRKRNVYIDDSVLRMVFYNVICESLNDKKRTVLLF